MITEKVSVLNSRGEKLIGLCEYPKIEEIKFATVILVHGFGVTKEEYTVKEKPGMFDLLARELVQAGFCVYRFDFSGRGESEGDYSDTSLTKQKNELATILDFVKSQEKVDVSRLGIVGQSFGTAVTVALQPDVKALVLMGSIANVLDIASMLKKWKVLDKEGISIKVKSNGEEIKVKPHYWKDLEQYELLSSMKKITCPILFIHGSLDSRVPLSEMEAYTKVAKDYRVKILEGAGHSLEPKREEMYKEITTWFEEKL